MTQVKLLGRGKVGWHWSGIEDGNRCSSSGGSLEDYLKEVEDGCLVYDAEQADEIAFTNFIVHGPSEDPSLSNGEIHCFKDYETLAFMLPALGGAFKTIGASALAGISSLDYVAPDVYIQLLRDQVPGVKTGRVLNGKIVWDSPAMPKETENGQLSLF